MTKICATSSVKEREVCGRGFDSSVAQYDEENIISGIVSLQHDILDDYKIFKLSERFEKNGFKELWAERGFYLAIGYKPHDMGNIMACLSLEHTEKKVKVDLKYDNLHTLIEMATRYITNWEKENAT